MSTRKPKVRLFVPDPLAAGHALTVTGGQAHYLDHVMRLRPGAPVLLFNGRDGEWLAEVGPRQRHGRTLSVVSTRRPQQPEPGPWLLFAPVKKPALAFLVEKATELGATRLWPVLTERTVAPRLNGARLRAHAQEAAEQCERLTVPEVADPVPLSALAAAWPAGRRLAVLDEHGAGVPIARAAADPHPRTNASMAFLVGPEGGFTAAELDGLSRLPYVVRVSLGPRILRAETAALAALACWQALAGDADTPPPPRG